MVKITRIVSRSNKSDDRVIVKKSVAIASMLRPLANAKVPERSDDEPTEKPDNHDPKGDK